jgi:hypothetical protein
MKKFLAIILVFGMLAFSGCGDTGVSGNSDSDNTPDTSNSQSTTEAQVLVDNDDMKVSFIEIFEEPSVPGMGYLRLKVENKTDKTITVFPQDVYVNDTSVILGSGVHMKLAPGKNSQAPFIIFYTNLGITSKDEIQKIEFRLTFDDENYDTIAETEMLVIDFSK